MRFIFPFICLLLLTACGGTETPLPQEEEEETDVIAPEGLADAAPCTLSFLGQPELLRECFEPLNEGSDNVEIDAERAYVIKRCILACYSDPSINFPDQILSVQIKFDTDYEGAASPSPIFDEVFIEERDGISFYNVDQGTFIKGYKNNYVVGLGLGGEIYANSVFGIEAYGQENLIQYGIRLMEALPQ